MNLATVPTVGGSATPGSNAKSLTGAAAPASNGTPVGSSSTPSAEAALVEAKRQAEHWRHKYERDITPVTERLAKLEGLAEGAGVGREQAKPASARTISDLDDTQLDDVVKKGFADENPGFVSEVMREVARRAADKAREEAISMSRAEQAQFSERQRVNAQIVSEYGAVALDENSQLRQRADQLFAAVLRKDKDAITRTPEVALAIFAQAAREIEANDRTELTRLREEAAARAAREEQVRNNQTFFAQRKNDVSDLLAKGDKASKRDALKKLLPFLSDER